MNLDRVKVERSATFMKYLASVVSLIFLPKSLIWNKITWAYEEYIQKNLPIFIFLSNLLLLNVKILRTYNERTRQLYKNPHRHIILLIINYQSWKSGGEGS